MEPFRTASTAHSLGNAAARPSMKTMLAAWFTTAIGRGSPLDDFRGLETRMNTSFRGQPHRALPSLLLAAPGSVERPATHGGTGHQSVVDHHDSEVDGHQFGSIVQHAVRLNRRKPEP